MNKHQKVVDSAAFRQAFIEQWQGEYSSASDDLLLKYSSSPAWTEFMLGPKSHERYTESFMYRVMERLNKTGHDLGLSREWYTIDAVFYSDETLIPKGEYPPCLDVIIEHENAEDVETEMWKLAAFRSPLKVLIFYDYIDSDRNTTKKSTWLSEKIDDLARIVSTFNGKWSENPDTEYQLIVGARKLSGEIYWRHALLGDPSSYAKDSDGNLKLSEL